MQAVQVLAALLVIAASVLAVVRKVDVRLALLLGGLVLGLVVGQPVSILRAFLTSLTEYKSVVPIACAMGFGFVLQHTGCGEQLALVLLKPFARMPALLLPGTVLIGFLVNIPIVSQSGTAATVGAVLVPVLLAAGLSPLSTGAALLIGCSIGGELLNPAGPEYATVIRESARVGGHVLTGAECVANALPLVMINLGVATLVFWVFAVRAERRRKAQTPSGEPQVGKKINWFKAVVPVLPLVVLFLTAKPFQTVPLPKEPGFLVAAKELEEVQPNKVRSKIDDLQDTRLIGLAMLIGVGAATLACLLKKEDRGCVTGIAKAFFEGTGFAFANVISLIAVAAAFAEGIKLSGIGDIIGHMATASPTLLLPLAGAAALLFAVLCGSGIAATQGLFGIFAGPAAQHSISLVHAGVFTSSSSAVGRTMSPVSAVGLMSAKLTSQDIVDLVKVVAPPLFAGFAASLAYALVKLA
jgi:DcuC family C4-dicarboxylate transporter